MANLKSLIRLRKHRIDEKQKALADLFRQVEALEARKKSLLETLAHERKIMEESGSLETLAFFGRFSDGIKKNVERIDSDLKKLEVRIQIAQDDIREAFADMKRIEIVQGVREKEEASKQLVKENAELDAIGIEGFRRKDELD